MLSMRTIFAITFVGSLAVLSSVRGAQDDTQGRRFGIGANLKAPLVSTELGDKLKLTEEQKTALEKLQKEFTEKTNDSVEKVTAAFKEKNRVGMKEAAEVMQTVSKTRGEYQEKVKGLLKDEQKKVYEQELKNQQTQARFGGAGQGARGALPGGGGVRVAPPVTTLLSSDVQEKLGLSAAQKEKLANLKKEMDSVLTEEQKKKFEELTKATPGGRMNRNSN